MNGIELGVNNQTVLIWLLSVKSLCGIELCSLNKVLNCMQIPLIGCLIGMKICLMGHLTDVSWELHSFLGFTFAFVFVFMTCDTIQCGVM